MTALHALDGAFERVRRADEHLVDLKREVAEALRRQENSVGLQFNPQFPERSPTPLLPTSTFVTMRVGILIGEACYNLRGALDYLVFELAKLDSGSKQNGTQFPIEDTPQGFKGRAKTYLKGIKVAHVAAIEQRQPYLGCNWTRTLREISNPDKHRKLTQPGGDVRLHAYARSDPAHPDFDMIQAPVRRTLNPFLGKEVDVKVHFTGKIGLADGTPFIEPLDEIKIEVAQTLTNFKAEF